MVRAIQKLIEHCADVNAAGEIPIETPLYLACMNGNYDAALVLVQNGANPYLSDASLKLTENWTNPNIVDNVGLIFNLVFCFDWLTKLLF